LFILSAGPAAATIATTPLPQFSDGKQSVEIAVIPGVVKRDRMETDFLCTSLAATPVDIGVQVFGSTGNLLNDVSAGEGVVLSVAPGGTATIGTSGTAAFLETTTLALSNFQGAARIVASSSEVRCNAVILDDAVSPPVSLATLGAGVRPAAGATPPSLALPQFSDGKSSTHSALISGVIKRGRMETSILCTSLATSNINIGVEILGTDGNVQNDVNAGNGALLDVGPGHTVTLGTTGAAALLEDQVISLGGVAQGAARIVSNSADLACTAFMLDAAVSPPVSMSELVDAGGDPQ